MFGRLRRKKMRCLITILWKSQWGAAYGELARWLDVQGFRPSKLSTESWEVFERFGSAMDCASHVHDFISWLGNKGFLNQEAPPPWAVVVTERELVAEWNKETETLPRWILAEFFNTVFLDDIVFAALREIAAWHASLFEYKEQFAMYGRRWVTRPVPRDQERAGEGKQVEAEIEQEIPVASMRNGPNTPPQKASLEINGFAELQALGKKAYADVPVDYQVGFGGMNALLLLSAERNAIRGGIDPHGRFVLYNATALGLRTTELRNAISILVRNRTIELLEVVAEPAEEVRHELQDSDEGQR